MKRTPERKYIPEQEPVVLSTDPEDVMWGALIFAVGISLVVFGITYWV